MLYLFLVSLFTLLFTPAAIARATASCPRVNANGPSVEVAAGEPLTFSANVSGGDMRVAPTYRWIVSGGMINSGQGTPVITVDTSGFPGGNLTATVEIGGFDRTCSPHSSWTSSVRMPATTRKYDEFNYLGPAKLEYDRLDAFAVTLRNETQANAYIILYLGRRGVAGAIPAWAKQTVDHLVKRGIERDRLTVVNGGYRDTGVMEIFIVPLGGEPPTASPTVDPSEIVTPAPKRKTRKRT